MNKDALPTSLYVCQRRSRYPDKLSQFRLRERRLELLAAGPNQLADMSINRSRIHNVFMDSLLKNVNLAHNVLSTHKVAVIYNLQSVVGFAIWELVINRKGGTPWALRII